eukprot:TRINITY_DN9285_c0_g1_i1.p1 TRINITY_DN9285_c0_g1~~TRINITY_DN9285_c0_g1_i1.p1  ORF type:complete len:388 (-),score=91.70 TRINITY_DN9285_c0_g1_i1:127-1290(-)
MAMVAAEAATQASTGGEEATGIKNALASCVGAACSQAVAETFKYSPVVGAGSLAVTFIGNGTHGTFAKLAGPSTPPFVYNVYLCMGLLLGSSLALVALKQDFEWTIYGFGAGALLAACLAFYVNAIVRIGIVWCDMLTASCATLASFAWGKLYFGEPSRSIAAATAGLAVLLLGILGISYQLAMRLRTLEHAERIADGRSLVLGLVSAIAAGTCGGTTFVMNKLQPADKQGMSFAWTQAWGALVVQLALSCCALVVDVTKGILAQAQKEQSDKNDSGSEEAAADVLNEECLVLGRTDVRRLLPLGLGQGFVLAITNLTTVIASLSPFGVAVAQPVRESGHVLAVLIGVFIFREFGQPDTPFVARLLSCVALNIAGIVLLVVFGSAPH